MEGFDPTTEQENILKILSKEGELTIDELYRELVDDDTSSFSYYSNKNSEERRLITRLLYFLRNNKSIVTNEGQTWALSTVSDEFGELLSRGMPSFDTRAEHNNILYVIRSTSQPTLSEIHSGLVEMDQSVFKSLPQHGWNEERHILIALRDTLRENEGLITNKRGGHYQTWALTQEGKQKVK